MRRREIMLLLGGAMIAAVPLHAQRKSMPVIGYLSVATPAVNALQLPAFHRGLGETGYVEGQNVAIEYRWAADRYDRLPALAADLVAGKVDLIVSTGGITGALAAKNATSMTPIVFLTGDDPVERGLVASLARPGGNLTGINFLTGGLMPKRLELLSELVPQVKAVALLVNLNNASVERVTRDVQETARAKGLELHILQAGTESLKGGTEDEVGAAFSRTRPPVSALIVATDPFFFSRRDQLLALAARYAIPAVYERREYTDAGGLISYGPSFAAAWRQAGIYAGMILKGATPADLPIQQPTKFELVINLKTAKALGLTIPPSILARADEIIE